MIHSRGHAASSTASLAVHESVRARGRQLLARACPRRRGTRPHQRGHRRLRRECVSCRCILHRVGSSEMRSQQISHNKCQADEGIAFGKLRSESCNEIQGQRSQRIVQSCLNRFGRMKFETSKTKHTMTKRVVNSKVQTLAGADYDCDHRLHQVKCPGAGKKDYYVLNKGAGERTEYRR